MSLVESDLFNFEIHLPVDDRSHQWFIGVFNESLSKLQPYPSPHYFYSVDVTGTKATSIALAFLDGGRSELLVADSVESALFRQNHKEIVRRYKAGGYIYDYERFLLGSLIVADEGNYVFVDCKPYLELMKMKKGETFMSDISKALIDYKVAKVFDINGNEMVDQREDLYKKMYSDFTSVLAQRHRWTTFEWLRFRLTRQWPISSSPNLA